VTCLAASEGCAAEAVVRCWARRFSMASRLRCPPVRFGNSGWPGSRCRSASQAQDGDGVLRERGDPLFAALAVAGDVRSCAEVNVAAGQAGQLGDPEPGLGGEGEHCVVAPPGPGGFVRGCEQGTDLRLGEPGDEGFFMLLGRDGQDAGDRLGVLGMAQGGVAEQGSDRGEAGVAGAGAVAPDVFEVVQEAADQRGVQVGDVELAGLFPGAAGGEPQEQPPGVPVSGNRLAAGVPLPGQPVGEERLQDRGKCGHGRSSQMPSRCPAAAISSGDADRYQYVAFGSTWPR